MKVDQLNVTIYPTAAATASSAAAFVSEEIRGAITRKGTARVIFATGNSQLLFLRYLIEQTDIDWTKVTAFHLDEYIGLPVSHPASFRRYLQELLFSKLSFGAVHLLDGEAPDPLVECERYSRLLSEAPIDVACVGIGENGHLAFNDPPADFDAPTLVHIVALDEKSRQQQVGEGHFETLTHVPTHALSLSIPAVMGAGAIACIVPEMRKAEPVYRTLREPISPYCPASILRMMFLDQESGSRL
jgi:glucosamine-6-phosphate deaminase